MSILNLGRNTKGNASFLRKSCEPSDMLIRGIYDVKGLAERVDKAWFAKYIGPQSLLKCYLKLDLPKDFHPPASW